MLRCVACRSKQVTKNGHIHNGKQRYKCKGCGRQFVYSATSKRISEKIKAQIDKLLLEKLSLAGIALVLDVLETWLQQYVNKKYAGVEQKVKVKDKKGSQLSSCDEPWSFVSSKKNQQWV
jgi:insertion element IS1 protein InsB